MTYETDVFKLVDDWINNRPREVRVEDAWKVACYFFPESEKREGGSHLYIVKWKRISGIIKKLGLGSWHPFNHEGEFLLVVKKKKVKWCYIDDLLKAIEIKEQLSEQGQKSKD